MTGAHRELLAAALRVLRRFALWWCAAIVAFVVLNLAFWPSFKGSEMLKSFEDMGSVMEAFGASDFASPGGYLDGQVFALMLPVLASAMTIASVTALTSGDEGAGRLELLHALPVTRRAIWLARFAAANIVLAGTALVVLLTTLVSLPVFQFDGIAFSDVGGPVLGCAALALFHGAVGYAAGAAGWTRPRAIGAAVVVLVVGYVVAMVLPIAKPLEAARNWSPWHWALGEAPAVDGVNLLGIAGVVALAAALVAAGTVMLDRRDIRTA